MKLKTVCAALAVVGLASPALANDKDTCAAGMICASNPQTIVNAMQEAGYRAKLSKDKEGDPTISSAAAGYDFDVFFYGCEKGVQCDSLQFEMSFVAEDDNTAEYANRWNMGKRFMRASVNDKKELYLRYDVSTIGGLNKTNFADVLDWWETMSSSFNQFVKDQKKK